MKIRTFLTCEDVDVDLEKSILSVKKMMQGLAVKELPTEESIVILLTLDEVPNRKHNMLVVLMNNKDRPISKWERELEPERNAIALRLKCTFTDPGQYYIKITSDGEFLGKYPFYIRQDAKEGVE